MDIQKIANNVNSIRFKKCESIYMGDILRYAYFTERGKRQFLSSIIHILLYMTHCKCQHKVIGNPTTVSLFSNSFSHRQDHRKPFESVTALVNDQIIITPSKRKLDLYNLKYAFLPIVWMFQLRKVAGSISLHTAIVREMYKAFIDYTYITRTIKRGKYNSIVNFITYCDVTPVDTFCTQMFNKKGFNTVTLQHGSYYVKTNSFAYTGSRSKYFLAESPVALNDAIKCGYKGQVIAVGSPHQIDLPQNTVSERTNDSNIGIIMNGESIPRNENIDMLIAVQEYCKSTGRKSFVKFHPGNNPKDYEHLIDPTITTTYGKEITIDDFGDLIDVAVVSRSTVFTTFLKERLPVFLFNSGRLGESEFPKTEFLEFSNAKELGEKIESMKTKEYADKLEKCCSLLFCEGDIRENYKKAFRQIGISTI